MAKAKPQVHVKGYSVTDETRTTGIGGAQLTAETPTDQRQESVIGKRAKGELVMVDGPDSRSLGSFDISFLADAKAKDVEGRVREEVTRMLRDNGIYEPVELIFEK